jgi:hypothetical protein
MFDDTVEHTKLRITAGAAGFLTLSQFGERPER